MEEIKLEQGSNEWHKLRKSKLGASDAPVILNKSPWKTPYQLFEEKLGLYNTTENSAMRRGTQLEPVALQVYNDLTGHDASPTCILHSDIDYLMASLDGLSKDKSISVEIKCPGRNDHELAKEGRVPEKYYFQLQHQLAVLGHDSVHYFSFSEGDHYLLEIQRDDEAIEMMLEEESKFWKMVKNFEAPPLTDRDYVTRSDQDWISRAERWKNDWLILKEAEKREKASRKDLIEVSYDTSCIGAGVQLTKYPIKGRVDYSAVPELKGVDLEEFRKPPSVAWRPTIK